MTTGADVYRKLMDLDLLLQDGGKMGGLYAFLCSVKDDHRSLVKLEREVEEFTTRIETLVKASEGR